MNKVIETKFFMYKDYEWSPHNAGMAAIEYGKNKNNSMFFINDKKEKTPYNKNPTGVMIEIYE